MKEPQPESDITRILYVDGSATNERSGVGLIVVLLEGHTYEDALKFMFKASKNEAEYEALLAGMKAWPST